MGHNVVEFFEEFPISRSLVSVLNTLPGLDQYPTFFNGFARKKDGSRFNYMLDWNFIKALDGKVVGYIAVITDFTIRANMENALRESEEHLRQYFEASPVGIAITALDKRWIDFNSTLCEILGYTREEMAGFTWLDVARLDASKKRSGIYRVPIGQYKQL